MRLSARNQLVGTVQSIKEGVVTAEVVIRLSGGEEIVAVITLDSLRSLGLKPGDTARAVIKSTDVMVAVEE